MKKSIVFIITTALVLLIMATPGFAQNQATQEANSIRERVEEKLQKAKNNPKAYLGTITDITEDTIQIKNESDEIQQILIDIESVAFVKVTNKTTSIEFEDVGIGDYIIAMGFENGDGILEAKRILSTQPVEPPSRKAVFGKITDIDKKTAMLVSSGQGEIILEFPKSWKGPEINELEEEMQIIAVYEIEEEKLTIRTIKIVSSSEPSLAPEETEN